MKDYTAEFANSKNAVVVVNASGAITVSVMTKVVEAFGYLIFAGLKPFKQDSRGGFARLYKNLRIL